MCDVIRFFIYIYSLHITFNLIINSDMCCFWLFRVFCKNSIFIKILCIAIMCSLFFYLLIEYFIILTEGILLLWKISQCIRPTCHRQHLLISYKHYLGPLLSTNLFCLFYLVLMRIIIHGWHVIPLWRWQLQRPQEHGARALPTERVALVSPAAATGAWRRALPTERVALASPAAATGA